MAMSSDGLSRYDVFISYSHRDEDWVHNALLPRLKAERIDYFIDYEDFEPGAPSLTEMERGVLLSRKTLLVLTPEYLSSEWTEFENLLAQTLDPAARARRLIPLMLKPVHLPLRVRALTYLDFTKGTLEQSQWSRLIRAIKGETIISELNTQVAILLAGVFEEFDSAKQDTFVRALAKTVSITPDQIHLVSMLPGSVLVTLEMPEQAALHLLSLYLAKDPIIQSLFIQRVELLSSSSTTRISEIESTKPHPSRLRSYNPSVERKLLTEAFTDEELANFCFDYFREVYEQFTTGMSKAVKIQRLIEHVHRHNHEDKLLGLVRSANPAKYAEYESHLVE
jgi:TIR domain/Effector-associated domain 7